MRSYDSLNCDVSVSISASLRSSIIEAIASNSVDTLASASSPNCRTLAPSPFTKFSTCVRPSATRFFAAASLASTQSATLSIAKSTCRKYSCRALPRELSISSFQSSPHVVSQVPTPPFSSSNVLRYAASAAVEPRAEDAARLGLHLLEDRLDVGSRLLLDPVDGLGDPLAFGVVAALVPVCWPATLPTAARGRRARPRGPSRAPPAPGARPGSARSFRLAILGLRLGLVLLRGGSRLQRLTERRLVAFLELRLVDVVLRHRLVGRRAVFGVIQPLGGQRRRNDGRCGYRRRTRSGCSGSSFVSGGAGCEPGATSLAAAALSGPTAASFCVAS